MERKQANWNGRAKWMAMALLLATTAMAQTTPRQHKRVVVVSIPDRKLALLEGDSVVKVYPVAVGARRTPSPAGEFKVVNRLVRPTYYHSGTVITPGPRNPLGTRWIGLSEKGYGIHGTNAPKSIGKAASHGCIRMSKADLEELFGLVQVGDAVEIRSEADSQTAALFHQGSEAGQAIGGGQ